MHFKMNIHWLQGREEAEKSLQVDATYLQASSFL